MLRSISPGNSLGKLARNLFLIGLFFHLLAAWFTVGYHHPDEYYQIVEFASYKLGKTPVTDLAWEFGAQIRPAFQPAMIYCLCKILNLTNPVIVCFLLRLISALTAWLVAFGFVLISLKECNSDKAKKAILYLCTFLWFMPYIHARFSSENWSSIFFFAGLSSLMLMMKPWNSNIKIKPNTLWLLLCGMLLGLSFVVRFQTGFMILGLGLWLLVYGKLELRRLFILLAGMSFSIFTGVLTDRWFYGKWILSSLNYFQVNVIEGKSADWGSLPWWAYFKMIFESNIPPFSIFILGGIFIFFIRFYKHPLTWICIPFLFVHIINAHKDLRFLFPLVDALPVVIGFAFFEKVRKVNYSKLEGFLSSRFSVMGAKVFLAINILLMTVVCLKPANEMFSFYNYIYDNYGNKETCLYTFSRNPYTNLPVDFFKPAQLSVAKVSKDSLANYTLFKNGLTNMVFEEGLQASDSWHPDNKKISMVYQNIPDWLIKINVNNWLKHTRVWRLYTIE